MTAVPARTLPPGSLTRIVAVVRALGLDRVIEELARSVGPADVLIEQVRGYGRQKGHLDEYVDDGFHPGGFLPKVRLEFTVRAELVDEAVAALRRGALTGRIGDGKIFVHSVESCLE